MVSLVLLIRLVELAAIFLVFFLECRDARGIVFLGLLEPFVAAHANLLEPGRIDLVGLFGLLLMAALKLGDAARQHLLGVAAPWLRAFFVELLELALELVLDPILVLFDELFGFGRARSSSGTACLDHAGPSHLSEAEISPDSRGRPRRRLPRSRRSSSRRAVPRPRPAITPRRQKQQRPDEDVDLAETWEA